MKSLLLNIIYYIFQHLLYIYIQWINIYIVLWTQAPALPQGLQKHRTGLGNNAQIEET
jgi:hypothetical protein